MPASFLRAPSPVGQSVRIGKSPAGGTVLWYFTSEGGGADPWQWRCLDSVTGVLVKRSSRSFGALWECAEDAQHHGYVRSPAQMATSFAEGLTRSFQTSTRWK